MDQNIGRVIIGGFVLLLVVMLGWCGRYMVASPTAEALLDDAGLTLRLRFVNQDYQAAYTNRSNAVYTGEPWQAYLPRDFDGDRPSIEAKVNGGTSSRTQESTFVTARWVPSGAASPCDTTFGMRTRPGNYSYYGEIKVKDGPQFVMLAFCVTGYFYLVDQWNGLFVGKFGAKDDTTGRVYVRGDSALDFWCEDTASCIRYIQHMEAEMRRQPVTPTQRQG